MKAKYLMLIAALAFTFTACENQVPFDTQAQDDEPLILKPYNESGTGSFSYLLANPDTPLCDSVTVTPSKYTTVNWFIDGTCVHSGIKIDICLLAGKYDLIIEAVTSANKRTERFGSVTVNPYASDPYAPANDAGRHLVPNVMMTIDGQNLDKVNKMIIARDFFGKDIAASFAPAAKNPAQLMFTLPAMDDGIYYLILQDTEGKLYGSDRCEVHNASVALDGFDEFVPGTLWTITGVDLQNVEKVTVDETVITKLTTTASSVSFIAPQAEVGEHTISMTNKDGSAVLFITPEGTTDKAKTLVSAETAIWSGPVPLDWNADLVKVTQETLADVPAGATILVYYDTPEAEYHAMRITTPWWGTPATLETDLVLQFDVTEQTPNPFAFTYDERCKGLVDERGAMSIVGFGVTINKITYK